MYQGNTSLFYRHRTTGKPGNLAHVHIRKEFSWGGFLGEGGADLDFLGSGEKVTIKWDERKTKEDYVESVHV